MGNLQQTGHGPGAITFQCESKSSLTSVVTLYRLSDCLETMPCFDKKLKAARKRL